MLQLVLNLRDKEATTPPIACGAFSINALACSMMPVRIGKKE